MDKKDSNIEKADLAKNFKVKSRLDVAYKDYLESDSWKCDKSPSGAHFWIIGPITYKNGMVIIYEKCKFCSKERSVVRKEY
jgi:hypothetical protein